MQRREINTFNDLNDTLYKSAWKSQFLSGLMQPIMMFVGNLGYVLVSIIGGFLAIRCHRGRIFKLLFNM